MIIASQTANALGCASGSWRIWSLSDGYIDLPAELLQEPDAHTQSRPETQERPQLRLSVNCFLFERSGSDRVLIDCGAGGSWDPSMGHLGKAMAEVSIDPSSITMIAFTHSHQDHVCGLLRRDGREAFTNLNKIVIAEDAVAGFLDWPQLTRFRSLLAPIKSGDRLADHLRAVAIPGHAPGHVGYVLSTGDDNIMFCGDLIHVPAAQFTRPELTWIYDSEPDLARATRIKLLADAAHSHTWLAGAHLGRPGMGKVAEEAPGYTFLPVV